MMTCASLECFVVPSTKYPRVIVCDRLKKYANAGKVIKEAGDWANRFKEAHLRLFLFVGTLSVHAKQ